MRIELLISALITVAALTACTPKDPELPKPQTDGVIPQAQLDALNKAKNVESVIMQGDQQRREQSGTAQ